MKLYFIFVYFIVPNFSTYEILRASETSVAQNESGRILFAFLSICVSIFSVNLSACLSVCLYVYLMITYPSFDHPCYLSIILSNCKIFCLHCPLFIK